MINRHILTGFDAVITVCPSLCTPENPVGILPGASIGIEGETLAWVGSAPADWATVTTTHCRGIAVPGLIDNHTHPVFAGDRANEFEARLTGKTYLDIAAEGGGILKSVNATRQADVETLVTLSKDRLKRAMAVGVTTMEVKSGYGLTTADELKTLSAIGALQSQMPMTLIPTFMGAHDIPPEYKGNTAAYVDLVCQEMIPAAAAQGIAQYCDVFCEEGYFDVAQSQRILETGMAHGLKPRIHAEEFVSLGGTEMACALGAHSADHLLHVPPSGVKALADSNTTVATLLPGTAFFLRMKDYAPARQLIDAGATVAIGSDFNPGSCTSQNLVFMMSLACLQMGMTPAEALRGVTLNAAKSLGLAHDRGSLTPGKRADIAVFDTHSLPALLTQFAVNRLSGLYIAGQKIGL